MAWNENRVIVEAIDKFSKESSRLSKKMICLTYWIIGIAVLQFVSIFVQIMIAILKR